MPARVEVRAEELRRSRTPFVHARVVLAERPTSAKPGDAAIVLADGTVEGFVGGTCAEASVRERSLAALASGESLVLRITPTAAGAGSAGGAATPGREVVHNPCLSGGSLEVFLEPHIPAPLVVVAGDSPIARALGEVGAAMGYDTAALGQGVPADAAALVVASHGRGEEAALTAALEAGVPYVGLVASPRRGAAVVASLDVPDEARARVRTPAGLDIGARSPGEVAVAILADVVAARPRPRTPPPPLARPAAAGIDPVCGMTVPAGADALHLDHGGRTVWFCGSGCMQAFRADPSAYPG